MAIGHIQLLDSRNYLVIIYGFIIILIYYILYMTIINILEIHKCIYK